MNWMRAEAWARTLQVCWSDEGVGVVMLLMVSIDDRGTPARP